jgi:hypothetical protein
MRPNEMHKLARQGCHDCDAPKGWHDVPNVTGDYDLDATILHRSNSDLPQRLRLYTKVNAYGYRTGYGGRNYGSDN